ncbi:hypothetical protein K7X08_037449 [Anisodus acutangulus]|uniref:HTH three-helical bundle domain-containing protein n=1 Tax=Anisodus acutangulus TaxID=402998 RepID=A0A9Q1RPF2_9SOLA|nr:hypothetical protein K7X08_037449 [Anisodus acutangulus]
MKEAFPSRGEREVASALLLLSTISTSPLPISNSVTEISASNSKGKSSNSSILTVVDGSFVEARSQSRRLKMIRDQIMKLKVVRKRRSKSFFISECRQMSSGKPATATTSQTTFCRSTMISTSSSSCVSTDSVFSARSLAADRLSRQKRDSLLMPAYLRRRSESVLRVLSYGSASEVRIRQMIGNSPDTSKALRM